MVLNDTTNLQGLIQDFERLTGIGIGNVSGDTTQKKNYIARANAWLDRAVGIILASDTRWQWDDSNFTTEPIGVADLVAGQDTYRFDSHWLKVTLVNLLNQQSNWLQLSPIDQADIRQGYSAYLSTAGTPSQYDVIGDLIKLKAAPSYNSVGGLKVFFQRRPYYFAVDGTDDTKEPGIPSIAHRLLSLGPAYDYAIEKNLPNVSLLREEIGLMEQRLEEFIGERSKYEKPRITTKRESFR
jgi:hypothetical protein